MSEPTSRRRTLKVLGATLGAGAFATALAPLRDLESMSSVDAFLQKHYKELTPDELQVVLARLERETKDRYGAEVTIEDVRPRPNTQFAYALNLSICIGCRRCAEACHEENNHDRRTHNSYIRVLEMEMGSMDMERGRVDYEHPVPAEGKFYMPVQCSSARTPPA